MLTRACKFALPPAPACARAACTSWQEVHLSPHPLLKEDQQAIQQCPRASGMKIRAALIRFSLSTQVHRRPALKDRQ